MHSQARVTTTTCSPITQQSIYGRNTISFLVQIPQTNRLFRIVVQNPQNWKDVQTNIAWLTSAINTLNQVLYPYKGVYLPPYVPDNYSASKIGIRTSASEWQQITGGATTWGADVALW